MTAPTLATTSVHDLVHRAPASREVLDRFGVDTCCGGGLTLSQAAHHAGVPLDVLLAELTSVLEEQH